MTENANGNSWIIKAAVAATIGVPLIALATAQWWSFQEVIENGKKLTYDEGFQAGRTAQHQVDIGCRP